MAHFGRLGSHQFTEEVDDIRGANVYGRDGEKLGKIDDGIFDHDTMDIQYVVVDSGGWFEAGRFLLPADRISANREHEDDFTADNQGRGQEFPEV
jgi:sporulation protein YlmC with PRC-barrel domain